MDKETGQHDFEIYFLLKNRMYFPIKYETEVDLLMIEIQKAAKQHKVNLPYLREKLSSYSLNEEIRKYLRENMRSIKYDSTITKRWKKPKNYTVLNEWPTYEEIILKKIEEVRPIVRPIGTHVIASHSNSNSSNYNQYSNPKLNDLKNIRKLRILKELLALERYNEISLEYCYLLDPAGYHESGTNVVYNIKCLEEIFERKNFGQCIEAIDRIILSLNSRMFKVQCELKWRDLIQTKQDGVRFCGKCSRHVFEVKDEVEFNKRRHLQQCVFFHPKITMLPTEGICIVKEEAEMLLGLPNFESSENVNDKLLPFEAKHEL
jgi:hypothetical protein